MKVIGFDFDGTLLNAQNEIIGGQKTVDLLNQAQKSGYSLAICTGRLDHDIVYISQKYDLNIENRISLNGAVVYKQDHLSATLLDKEDALKVNQYLQSYENDVRVEINTVSNRIWKTPRSADLPKEFYDSSMIKTDFAEVINYQPVVSYLLLGDNGKLLKIQKDVQAAFKNINAIMTSKTSLELTPPNISKGLALHQMYPGAQIYAIGDAESDLAMKDYSEKLYMVNSQSFEGTYKVQSITEALSDILVTEVV